MVAQLSQVSEASLDEFGQAIPQVSNVVAIAQPTDVTPISVENASKLKEVTQGAIAGEDFSDLIFPFNVIIGTARSDFLPGGGRPDLIFGLQSDDFLVAGGGDDYLFGGSGNDLSFGENGNDTFTQWSGNKFVDGTGNDTLVGGAGTDKVDYSFLGQPVTLEAAGQINKGSAGTDQIFEVEEIVGAIGEKNAIDGSTGTGTASFDVNLFDQELAVLGLPFGDLKFSIENFVEVKGTPNNDKITGDNNPNTLNGQAGDDEVFGLGGNDNVRGGAGDDLLRGDAGNDTVRGGTGNDTLQGGFNDDLLVGAGGRSAGTGEQDVLTGGFPPFILPFDVDETKTLLEDASRSNFREVDSLLSASTSAEDISVPTFLDKDTFVLGNRQTPFYLGDSSFGLDDFAQITDFQSGADTIQLNGSSKNYLFLGSSLIFQNNGSAGLDSSDDLIGFVGGTGFNTNGSDFKFVG
ncbi:MAG: calcium-binding protein [Cyanobacteria bacterium J06592_8]